jgi:hypothetical protein
MSIVTQDMIEQAWITYVDASMSAKITNHEAMRAVLEEAFLLSGIEREVERLREQLSSTIMQQDDEFQGMKRRLAYLEGVLTTEVLSSQPTPSKQKKM